MKKFIYLSLLVSVITYSQNNQPPVHYPVAPSTWEFAKFGNVPVNEYRGLANISIPIENIELDNVSLPIKLDYYSGGVRVGEEAGIVGLGWSMNMPTIVQSVKDNNDYNTWHQKLPPYQGNPALPTQEIYTNPSIGGIYNVNINGYVGVNGIQNIPYYANVTNGILVDHTGYYNTNYKYGGMIHEGIVDSEPDIFSLNLNGDEIKFSRVNSESDVLNSQNEPLLPLQIINGKTEYKVELIPSANSNIAPFLKISGIKVTDPSGNLYYFDKLEIINPGGTINYKLSKIETYSNKLIVFNYFEGNVTGLNTVDLTYLKRTSGSYTEGANYQCKAFDAVNGDFFGDASDTEHAMGTGDNPNTISTNHISQNYLFLNSITLDNKIVLFEYSDRVDYYGMKKMDKITIKNTKSEIVKEVLFSYDYFNSSSDNSPRYNIQNHSYAPIDNTNADRVSKRLRLVSLTEVGNNPYIFEYNTMSLPKKNSYSTDYWGFYNGSNNANFKPNLAVLGYPNVVQNTINNHNSNLFYCKAGTLEKIIYPTKGYTLFNYELNQFDNMLYGVQNNPAIPAINNGAGLRIKNIQNFNYSNELIDKKTFDYFGGKAIFKKVLVNAGNYEGYWCNNQLASSRSVSLIASSLNNFINNNSLLYGDYIGYDTVKIYNDVDNGYIEKKFHNQEYNLIFAYSNLFMGTDYYDRYNSYMNGTLLNENIYNNQNNLVTKKEFQYNQRPYILNYGMNKKGNGFRICPIDAGAGDTPPEEYCNLFIINPRMLLTFYPISFKSINKIKETTTEFFGNKSVATVNTYSYNAKNLISNVRTSNVGVGNAFVDESYIYTYNHPYLTSLSTLHTNKNMLTFPSIITKRRNNVLLSELQYTYENYASNSRIKIINEIYDSQINSTKKTFVDEYDEKDNILQYHKENNINTCVIWGYNKTLPVAKIENATYSSISSSLIQAIQDASDTGNESQLLTQLENLRISLPNAIVTCYTHKPLIGVSTMIDSRGNKVKYHYDSNNRLEFIEDNDSNVLSENEYHYKD